MATHVFLVLVYRAPLRNNVGGGLLELSNVDPEDKKTKVKDAKHKGTAMLAAEPKTKRGCDHLESSKGKRLFCAFHNVYSYNTGDC